MRVCVYGASSSQIDESYLTAGEELGRAIARKGWGMVFGGGALGLMGAAARGMTAGGGTIIGVVPTFLNVDGILYEQCKEMIYTSTMRERKQRMEELSDAFIITPGGIGTLDEFFEILTLRQLGRHGKPIGILNTNGYYDSMLAMLRHCAEESFLRSSVVEELAVSDVPEELLDLLEEKMGQGPQLNKDLE